MNNISFTLSNKIEPLLIAIIENESFKQKVVKLQDEIQECKKASLEINEQLNKIELKEALKALKKIRHDEGGCKCEGI